MAVRDPGAITARSFLLPGVGFAIFLALAAGALYMGVRADWDMSYVVGTGRNRTTTGLGLVIVAFLSLLALGVSIRLLRRELGFARATTNATDAD